MKRGFTFIEMLGVITLLSLISIIVLVVVDKSLKDSKGTLYNAQLENVKSSARMWMTDNIELIPDDGFYIISLGLLQDKGYISNDIKTLIEDNIYNKSLLFKISLNDIEIIDNKLFYDYDMVDYIKTDGNQYIDLNYFVKTSTSVDLDFELIENDYTYLDLDYGNNILGIGSLNSDDRFTVNFGAKGNQEKNLYYWVDKAYDGIHKFDNTYPSITGRTNLIIKNGLATFQGISHNVPLKTNDNIDSLILLGSYSSSVGSISSLVRYDTKLYGFKIYEGDNLVMNLIPCNRKSDNVLGLYDLINNVFYDSDGASNFIY